MRYCLSLCLGMLLFVDDGHVTGQVPGDQSSSRSVEDATRKELAPADTIDRRQLVQSITVPDAEDRGSADSTRRAQRIERRRPRFIRLLAGELEVVAVACNPTEEQRRRLAEYLDAWLEPALVQFADDEEKPLVIRIDQGARRQEDELAQRDPRQVVTAAVQQACRQLLTAEQAGQYDVELKRRRASRRQAAIQNAIVSVDRYLMLTAEQRSKLEILLENSWEKIWEESLPEFVHSGEFVPAIPSELVEQVLTRAQRLAYRRLATVWPKISRDDVLLDDDNSPETDPRSVEP